MTRSELVCKIARQLPNLTIRDVDCIISVLFDKLTAALVKGNRIEIRGFGAFTVRTRNPRITINPVKRVALQIPERRIVHFRTGKELRDRLNA